MYKQYTRHNDALERWSTEVFILCQVFPVSKSVSFVAVPSAQPTLTLSKLCLSLLSQHVSANHKNKDKRPGQTPGLTCLMPQPLRM